jgi:hypothetical protein
MPEEIQPGASQEVLEWHWKQHQEVCEARGLADLTCPCGRGNVRLCLSCHHEVIIDVGGDEPCEHIANLYRQVVGP